MFARVHYCVCVCRPVLGVWEVDRYSSSDSSSTLPLLCVIVLPLVFGKRGLLLTFGKQGVLLTFF